VYIPKYTVSNKIATNTGSLVAHGGPLRRSIGHALVPTTPGPQDICDLTRLLYVNWCCIANDILKDGTVCLYINTKHKFTHSRLN